VPDISSDSETARSITSLGYIPPNTLCESVVFKVSDSLGKQASTDKEEDTSGTDQEPVKGRGGTGLVNEVAYIRQSKRNREYLGRHTDDCAGNESDNDGDGDGDSWDTE